MRLPFHYSSCLTSQHFLAWIVYQIFIEMPARQVNLFGQVATQKSLSSIDIPGQSKYDRFIKLFVNCRQIENPDEGCMVTMVEHSKQLDTQADIHVKKSPKFSF